MRKLLIPLVLTLLLSACREVPEVTAPVTISPSTVRAESLKAAGFTVGNPVAKQTVYVYFDAQCPHCGELWDASQALLADINMIWIPVAVLNAASLSQGSAILSAPNPVSAMTEHEADLRARHQGIKASPPDDAHRKVIEYNTKLFTQVGGTGIPFIVSTHAVTGESITMTGSVHTAELRKFLGIPQ